MPVMMEKRAPMRVVIKGAILGTVLFVLFSVASVYSIYRDQGGGPPGGVTSWFGFWLLGLIRIGTGLGPVMFLIGGVLTWFLYPLRLRVRDRLRFIGFGMVCGLSIVFLATLVFGAGPSIWSADSIFMYFFSGIGLGLGCALAIPFRDPDSGNDSEHSLG